MAVLLCLWCVAGAATAQGIYTCVDAKGRKITADRPIVDCIDREQQELSRQGTVLRKVSPTMTAKEQVVKDEKDKLVAAEQARQQDEKRRDRALLLRYPNRKAHDRERELALAMVDDVIASSEKRTQELLLERVAINTEMEFYVRDPSKAPFALKDRMAINTSNQQEQKQFVITQGAEKARLNRRFDEELQTLQPLWARNAATKP
jgi:hypothetical protein